MLALDSIYIIWYYWINTVFQPSSKEKVMFDKVSRVLGLILAIAGIVLAVTTYFTPTANTHLLPWILAAAAVIIGILLQEKKRQHTSA